MLDQVAKKQLVSIIIQLMSVDHLSPIVGLQAQAKQVQVAVLLLKIGHLIMHWLTL
jgi:hypothetical protein